MERIKLIFFSFITLYILSYLDIFLTLDIPGRNNQLYPIDNYLGSRYNSNQISTSYINDNPSVFYYSNMFTLYNLTNLWFADIKEHTIKFITAQRNLVYVIGRKNITGLKNGDSLTTTFNGPSSIIFSNRNSQTFRNATVKYFVSDYASKDCLNNYNSTICDEPNFDFSVNITTVINISRIYFEKALTNNPNTLPHVAYITDKWNHCIRSLDLNTALVTTWAGICGKAGDKDGIFGDNLLNGPDGIGADDQGNLIVNDSLNGKLKIIFNNGSVASLVNGACFHYKNLPTSETKNIFNYSFVWLACFKNWIASSNYTDPTSNYCYDQHIFCPNAKNSSPLIYNRNYSRNN